MEISEALFDAVGILIDKKIQSIKFDETIEATVTDAKKASSGEYIVSTGAAKFTAYSYDTQYREKDVVLVTIPQGNYDNQKIIISKKVANQNDPMVYQTPFEKFINISNNLIKNTSTYKNGLGIWANYNDTDYSWPIDKEFNEVSLTPIWTGDYTKSPLQGYLMLGVQAQFASYLADYYTVQGNYGLALQITFKEPSLNQTWNKYVFLDSDSFFGDPYNFETYYTQEEVFNISEYVNYPIVGLKLYLYQRNNFKDNEGNDIPAPNDEDWDSVSPNIYVKDPFVCVGIPIDTFQGDTAEIYCDNDLTYTKNQVPAYYVFMPNNKASMFLFRGGTLYWSNSEPTSAADLSLYLGTSIDVNQEGYFYKKVAQLENSEQATFIVDDRTTRNTKNIQLRWIHKDESSGIIKALSYDDIFSTDYEIRWYRYKLGAQSPDEFAGAHWERYYGVANEPDENQDWGKTQENDEATNQLQIKFIPNVNYQTEQIKAIILKKESDNIYQRIAISNILTFTNDTQISNPATILDMNALAIKYDDEDNYNGNFYVYNHSNQLESKLLSNPRTLTAVFDPNEHNVNNKADLSDYTSVTWYFPRNRTMITTTEQDQESDPNFIVIKNTNSISYQIKQTLDLNAVNNTVRLEVLKDGQLFTAYTTMYFGENGLNGSPYTFYVVWDNGNNILNLPTNNSEENALKGKIFIKDSSAAQFDGNDNLPQLTWSWHTLEIQNQEVNNENANCVQYEYEKLQSCYLPILTPNESIFNNNEENVPSYFLLNAPDGEEYYYNFKLNKFVKESEKNENIDDCYPQPYGLYDNTKSDGIKQDFEFHEVTFEENPINLYTGQLQDRGWSNIHCVDNNKDTFYFSSNKRFFIKQNDRYILDPWPTYSEGETYYYPKLTNKKIYSNDQSSIPFHVSIGQHYPWELKIYYKRSENSSFNETHDINSLLILQLILSHFGDYNLIRNVPIILSNLNDGDKIYDLLATTEVRYDTSGTIDYMRLPYRLAIQHGEEIQEHTLEANSLIGYWSLLFDNNSEDNFKPRLRECKNDSNTTGNSETGINSDYNRINVPSLEPISIYMPEARAYGTQFYAIENNVSVCKLTIPVLVTQNNYPLEALNEWNGKDIVTDEENGTIIAKGFSAGKKESNNTFSGVVIGDWSHDAPKTLLASNTGVYGFNHGALSYAFKDDGTGFIGKDGRGRIHFKGDSAQIYSSNWLGNEHEGMLLDIDDGFIKMISPIQDQLKGVPFYPNDITDEALDVFRIENSNPQEFRNQQDNYPNSGQYQRLKYAERYRLANGEVYNSNANYYELANEEYSIINVFQDAWKDRENKIKVNYTNEYRFISNDLIRSSFMNEYFTQQGHQHILRKINNSYVNVQINEQYNKSMEYIMLNNNNQELIVTYALLKSQGFLYSGETLDLSNNLYIKHDNNYEQVTEQNNTFNPSFSYYQLITVSGVPNIYIENSNKENLFYSNIGNGSQLNFNNYFYRIETYEISNEKKYITLSSQESAYPLAIGKESNTTQRNFRVSWDGTLYAKNGQFNGGTISGSTISAGIINGGSINGSIITTNSINIDTTLNNLFINGQIGAFEGNDGQSSTACLGITSTDSQSGRAIVLLSCKNIKLASSSQNPNEGLYLQGNVIRIQDRNTNGWKTLSEYIDDRIAAALDTNGSIAVELAKCVQETNPTIARQISDLDTRISTLEGYHNPAPQNP